MSTAAWMMMTATWAVIGFLTARFLWKALRTPPADGGDGSTKER